MSLDVTLRMCNGYTVCDLNITHNLITMASHVGLYWYIWHPELCEIYHAKDLINPLTIGLKILKSQSYECIKYNPPNGWGTYDSFVGFVSKYLEACIAWPDALIEVSR